MVKIFVGRLAPSVSSSQLRELFEKYGPVSDCDILRDYGFVHMSHESDAERAINALDKFDLCGSRLSVELSTSRSMKSCQLFVKNLPNGVTNEDLHKLFKKFGTVTLCKINNNIATVHMRFPSMATNAVRNLSGELYRGNVLSVEFANNAAKPPWAGKLAQSSYNNGESSTIARNNMSKSATNPTLWKQSKSSLEHSLSDEFTSNSINNSSKLTNSSDLRDGRRVRIKQGLKFLQSPMPWSGTAELYETFLNQLKEMLLEEGLELFRESSRKEAVAQLSEAINISHYMKAEGINGHLELQDRLYMELAMMKFHMGDKNGALQNAEQAFSVTEGKNQIVLRFKAKILVQCERRTEALAFMVKCQSTTAFDAESEQLLNTIKQSVGLNGNQERQSNTKGAIGEGRNRPTTQQGTFPSSFPTQQSPPSNVLGRSLWSTNTDNSLNTSSSFLPYSNFENRSSLFEAPMRDLPASDNKLLSPESTPFQPFYAPDSSTSTAFTSQQPSLLLDAAAPKNNLVSAPINPPSAITSNNFAPSLFSSDLYSFGAQTHNNSTEPSLPLPIGYRRPQGSSFSSLGGNSLWGDSPLLGLGGMNNDSSVDKTVDEELARAIENELSVSSSTDIPFPSQDHSWRNNLGHPGNSQGRFVSELNDKSPPHYTHFPSDPSKGGYTGSVIGPAMLGIHSISQSASPMPSAAPQGNDSIEITTAASLVLEPGDFEVDENDSLSEILRNPLHDTHEFKLGCTDCVLRTGPRVVDFRHDESKTHSCYRNILLCRRRGNMNWLKIRPRPQPQSKAQLYDGPYYICKDLMSGQDCTYPAVCTFAYNQEEIDVWTLERKGMLNRAWLCKSMDPNFVKNLSLVGLILCKHRGSFEFLCKVCFQHKPRIISKFKERCGKCSITGGSHKNSSENQQLTHILRDGNVRYTEIRAPLQAIMCRHAIRFQCTRGPDCHFAHSLVERDVWAIMNKEGLSAADVVLQSNEHILKQTDAEQSGEIKSLFAPDGCLSEFRWKVKFICSICHKNGLVEEATKDMKYCTARAQHSWTNNKKVMLVQTSRKSWVQVRDLPYLKNKALPVRFELCENFRRQKKCSFSNKCNFAHSQEEMDIWMFLRENQLKDIEELYEARVKEKQAKAKRASQPSSNLVTKSVEVSQSLFHCWLCDVECKTKSEWDKHCLSDKHNLMAKSDSDGNWRFRKPAGYYEICKKHEKGICEFDSLPASENQCNYAHSKDELEEWLLRRNYVINRIRKAKDDNLISSGQRVDDLLTTLSN